jgi:hypothetical protein
MAHVPLALSVHNFIDKVGSDAGFASIIGLAILVLLYFAQARETSTLRDEAEQAGERVRQLEAQVAHLGRTQAVAVTQPPVQRVAPVPGRPVAVPAARPLVNPSAPSPAPAPAVAVASPAPPAGVAAPALAAATRLIPTEAPVVTATVPPPVATGVPPPAPAPDPTPAPATAAGGANGAGQRTAGPPPISQPLPRVQLRPGGAAAAGRPSSTAAVRRSAPAGSRIGRGFALLITAAIVAAIVAILLIVTSGGGGKPASNGGTPTSNAPSANRPRKPAFEPSSVTVTVLNGTATAGAAAKISGQLGGAGYTQGLRANAASQTQATTTVAYLPGHRPAAIQVAKTLRLSSRSVAPIDPTDQTIACASSGTCSADVVVILGADLASQ